MNNHVNNIVLLQNANVNLRVTEFHCKYLLKLGSVVRNISGDKYREEITASKTIESSLFFKYLIWDL